jgi:hypothetical protein
MGQPVAVVEKPSTLPGVVRFEANRNLTGMGHEHFASAVDAVGPRPAAELARRLFSSGRVAGVHMFGNQITVDLATDQVSDGLVEVIRDLYQYWKPGMAPPAFEDLVAPEESAPAPSASDAAGGDALSEAAKRVPAHLLERSRQARERWATRSA